MSFQNPKTWKNYSEMQKCWVPNCSNSRTNGYTKNFFLLPIDMKYRELWIGIAGKKVTGSQEEIYFCQDHFSSKDMEIVTDQPLYLKRTAIPLNNMPQKICRTCMSLIGSNNSFSLISRIIPSAIPTDMKLNLPQCRPEPLYQILTFCIPDLNLQPDPPPLVCCKCYQNIWLYFAYKITANAVEKGLRGNLTPEEYGKMVLCRTCPQTSGTSFFVLAEDTLMGSILKKMFLNEFPSDVVPLKVCLRCWNTLYKLKNFYEQCLAVDQKMQRHILLNQSGLGNINPFPVTVPTPLDAPKSTVSRLRDVRNIKNNMAFPQVDQNKCHANVEESITKSQTSSNVDNSLLLPSNSVIKFTSSIEQRPHIEKKESSTLPPDPRVCLGLQTQTPKTPPPQGVNNTVAENGIRPDVQHDTYKRGYTWVPPHLNTKPVVVQKKANTWIPPVINTPNMQSMHIEEKPNTRSSSVGNSTAVTQPINSTTNTQSMSIDENSEENHYSRNVTKFPNSSAGACNNTLQKKDFERKIGSEHKPVNDVPDTGSGCVKSRINFHTSEKIALAQLMLKYGEPLKNKTSPEIQFNAWINVIREFHKINNKRSLESIQDIWKRMKKKAEFLFKEIGPAEYEDQLVINYIYYYPSGTNIPTRESTVNEDGEDSDVTCLDDEISNVEIVTKKRKIDEANTGSGASSSKMPVGKHPTVSKRPLCSNSEPIKRKRGRPKKNPLDDKTSKSAQEIKKDHDKSLKTNTNRNSFSTECTTKKKKEKSIVTMKEWGYKQNLELARAVRKEFDKSLKNNELKSGKSPWRLLLKRLTQKKYSDYPFDKLYYLWSKMKRSATIYEKNGQDLVDEEVWELLQAQNAVQRSLVKNSTCTRATEKDSTVVQNNKPPISSANSKPENRTTSLPSRKYNHSESSSNSDYNGKGSDSDVILEVPVKASGSNSKASTKSTTGHKKDLKTSLTSHSKANTKSTTDYKKDLKTSPALNSKVNNTKSATDQNKHIQHWTEDEKIEFFKLIKQEYNSMVKNKEILARPWRKIIERIASRGFKNYNQEMLFSSWSAIRRNATLHENDRQLTMLDCKVLRLLRLANKLKVLKELDKMPKDKDNKKKTNNSAHSETVTDKNVKTTANSKAELRKNKHKEISRTVRDEDSQKVDKDAANSHNDEGDDDDKNSGTSWTHKEKMDLVEVVKSYGNEIFKPRKLKRRDFWGCIVTDFKAKGYKKTRSQVNNYWYHILRSAKLAWAQQKQTAPWDKAVIDFMMEEIAKKEKAGECSNEIREGEDSSDDETSDRMSELSDNPEDEASKAPISCTNNGEDNKKSDDDIVDLDYDYVSLEDLETDFAPNKTAESTFKVDPPFKVEPVFKVEPASKVEPTFTAEPSYVSMEDCAIEFPLTTQREEVIVIDDSDEE